MDPEGLDLLNFEQRINNFIKKNNLIAPRRVVIVGVSGGADSMALLNVLSDLRHDLGIQLHAAHFNHKFRPGSKHDELFVSSWCKKLNVPLTIGCRKGGRIKHLSENDARQMRFRFLIKTAKDHNAQSIALGHNLIDLAETVLMRLIRGSGLYGLRAIVPCRSINGVDFIRPLLDENRQEIEIYLKTCKIPFCTDVTNTQKKYERNKVRLGLIPLLSKDYNPQIINALADLAVTAGEDYDFLALHARRQLANIGNFSRGRVKVDLKGITRQHPAISRLIFRLMAEKLTNDPAVFSFENILAIEDLLSQKNQGAIDLPHSLKALKTKKSLELYHG